MHETVINTNIIHLAFLLHRYDDRVYGLSGIADNNTGFVLELIMMNSWTNLID